MRLVLCDGNRLLCEALGVALENRGHQVLAIATTTTLGIAAVAAHQPDACLLDLRFPDPPDGLAAARAIQRLSPGTAVLMLTGLVDQAAWSEAMRIGVAGVVLKDHDVGYVAAALDVIASGGVVFDPLLPGQATSGTGTPRRQYPDYELTPREKEVLRRMVAGQSTRQMSREMNIEVSTLRTYVKNVLTKLGVHSRLQAAALATTEHLVGDRVARPSA
jgi:two-component system nitrate/nitrite response regulator NarL